MAEQIIAASLDRLGVCNRLNLLLISAAAWDDLLPVAQAALAARGVTASLPPHHHPLGQEWALLDGPRGHRDGRPGRRPGRRRRAGQRRRPPAWPPLSSPPTRRRPASSWRPTAGTGAFWNVSTRLLDGFKLRGVPETGINVDHVPGPRGPVTFQDLCLRQYVVRPAAPHGRFGRAAG